LSERDRVIGELDYCREASRSSRPTTAGIQRSTFRRSSRLALRHGLRV